MRLSVLDQSTIVTGRPPAASIRETVALARHADALGFHRFWVSEHHNSAAIAGTAPEVLLGALAASTTRIRLGSAGVMLPHYSSLKVAEQFRVLDALAPGRIDLGLGRAPGSDGHTALALNPDAARAAEYFPAQVRDVLAWVRNEALPEQHPFRDLLSQPLGDTAPEVWVLGSSDYGAQVAAHFGLPYCFAHFITDGHGARQALSLYREGFRPSARHPEPNAALCVWAVAADTEAEASRLLRSREIWRLGRDRGDYQPLPSPEEAQARTLDAREQAQVERVRAQAVSGSAADVAGRLSDLARDTGADELAVLTTVHDPQARRHSYTLLAEAFGLPGMAAAAQAAE